MAFPPLIGFFFTYTVILNYEKIKNYKDYNSEWYQSIFFILIAEILHGFEVFSTAIFFSIFYYFIFTWLLLKVKFRNLFLVILVIIGYLGSFMASNLVLHIKDESFLPIGYEYIFYILIESVFVLLVFKGRII
ncbi:hypothetical protein CRN67_06785 [Campylobacter blaseri]|uniref:Uncharacterized protein n=1 Tax=Campylobacter blaseri TaxID=2042961 RepID=A0A2P8R052_9BACT|nr:hypothetical protein CQ405_06780 [Campylobacter blaseri]PSM53659.1 hypothetical protein CRN67_06785 [Campylobacter blaseri]